MNCPKCGKERVSDQTSFCSKCGLYLDFLEAIMKNEGYPPDSLESTGSVGWLSRKNVRLTALLWFVVVTAFMLPISAIMGGPSKMLAVLGLMGPVGAAFLLVMSMFFPTELEALRKPASKRSLEERSPKGLESGGTMYAEEFVAPAAVRDPMPAGERPPSVTEETTRHLDERIKNGS